MRNACAICRPHSRAKLVRVQQQERFKTTRNGVKMQWMNNRICCIVLYALLNVLRIKENRYVQFLASLLKPRVLNGFN